MDSVFGLYHFAHAHTPRTFDASGTYHVSLRLTLLSAADDPLAVWHCIHTGQGAGGSGVDRDTEAVVFDAPLWAITL